MKKYIPILTIGLMLGVTNLMKAQVFDWQKRYNVANRSLTAYGVDQAPGTDNGYLVVGISANTSPASEIKAYALKTKVDGDKDLTFGSQGTFTFSFFSNAYTYANAVKSVLDGYIIVGSTRPTANDKWNVYVTKISLTGGKLWEKSLGNTSTNELAYSVDVAPNGTIAVAGTAEIILNGKTQNQAMLLLLNPSGAYLTASTVFDSNVKLHGDAQNDAFRSVKYTTFNGGGFAMVGSAGRLNAGNDYTECMFVTTDITGNQSNTSNHFTKYYTFDANKNTNVMAGGIVPTVTGGYAIAGYESNVSEPNTFQSFLLTTNSFGMTPNFKRLPIDDGRKAVNSIANNTLDSSFVLAGSYSKDENVGMFYNYSTGVNKNLTRTWEIGNDSPADTLGTSPNSGAYAVIRDRANDHIIVGRTRKFPDDYMYIAKLTRPYAQKINVQWPNADESYTYVLCEVYIERKGKLIFQGTTSSEGHFILYDLMKNDKIQVRSTKRMIGYGQGSVVFTVPQATPIVINLSPNYVSSQPNLD